jgi:hypothetical protein
MSKYFISICFNFCLVLSYAQNRVGDSQSQDTADYKQPYGIRAGIDLSRPILSLFNSDYTGLEFVGDYRLTSRLYLAAELGNEKKTNLEELGNVNSGNPVELYNFTTSGSYLKLGVDYNTYENWYGMNNSIYIGGRYAVSSFSQTLNSYSIYDSNRYWSDTFLPGGTTPEEFSGLNATWLEFVFGAKAELFANIYLGASVRLGFLISNKEAEKFPNLWIPGFNKVTDGSKFGVGYNYSISYFLPLYKKSKKPKPDADPSE